MHNRQASSRSRPPSTWATSRWPSTSRRRPAPGRWTTSRSGSRRWPGCWAPCPAPGTCWRGTTEIEATAWRTRERQRPESRVRGDNPRLRVIALTLLVLLVAGTIWARLFYWQVMQHGELSKWAVRQYEQVVPLPPARGILYDRDLRPLAVNTTVYSIFISPAAVRPDQRGQVAASLSQLLGVDHDQLLGLLASGRQFAYVARRQPKEKADQVQAAALPGVGLEPEQQRSYLPGGSDGSLAAN